MARDYLAAAAPNVSRTVADGLKFVRDE